MHEGTACQKDLVSDNTTLHPIVFASKSLTGVECRYSNMKKEALFILHELEKFHHYCFAREILIITNHKPLVAIFKKDVATLSQHIQCILLKNHQYRVQIIYKPGPENFIADWLSQHKHKEGRTSHQRYGYKNRCHTKCNRHPGMHLHITNPVSISADKHLKTSKKHDNNRLAKHKG